jgi:regulator of protease activity HflC (stomatin/prohibitin superfamily)
MDSSQVPLYIFYGVLALFALGTILSGFFQVMTAEAVVIQRMGKFQRVATADRILRLPSSKGLMT